MTDKELIVRYLVGDKAALKGKLLAIGKLLGILEQDPATWLGYGQSADGISTGDIETLLEERTAAKKAKDFARADAIRKELDDKGILIEDTAQGPVWKKK